MSSQLVPARAGLNESALPGLDVNELDRMLDREVGIEREADRRLGRVLRGLKAGGRYQRLGFVGWGDYVLERVGVELRWSQELERLDRACEKMPELGAALGSGELVKSKVLELFRVVDEGTPALERRQWIERARGMTVRELRREIATGRTCSAPLAGDPDVTEAGSWVAIRVPMRVASLWQRAVERVRRLSNSEVPLFRCLEYIVADRMSALGWPEGVSPPPALPESAPAKSPPPVRQRTMSAPVDAGEVADPWELDHSIQTITALKKQVRRRQGELLQALAAVQGWCALGFTSLEHYAEERLGLHPRTVRRLIRFHRALAQYPPLARGYFAGQLTYLQVLQLLRVVTPRTARAWAVWAAKRSYLDTQRAVAEAEPYARSRTMSALPPAGMGTKPRLIGLLSGEPEPLPALIRFWCPADLLPFICAGLRSCRDLAVVVVGLPPPDWRCLDILLQDFLEQALDPALYALIARYPELERDGWRCTVPTCSRRVYLHSHHLKYLSQGGSNALWNKTLLCLIHHLAQQHGTGAIRVTGRAPDRLIWEIGRRPRDGLPLLRFYGRVKISDELQTINRLAHRLVEAREPMLDSAAR